LCRGACCTGGDTHAYLDERTLARVRRDRPDLGVQAILRLYHASIAAVTFEGSCVFHGAAGCTLPRMLRSDLCNSFYCKGLQSVVQAGSAASAVSITASDGAVAGRSAILHRSVRG
jgi:hypothetical protein